MDSKGIAQSVIVAAGLIGGLGLLGSQLSGGINAFAMGVKSVNADARVYVKVTNTWFDVTKEIAW